MKRIKLLPSVLILVLCVGILAIGVYAASPITGTIAGTINITAAQGVKIAIYEGTETTAENLIDSAFGSSKVELNARSTTLDASEVFKPEDVSAKVYTIVLSTNQNINYVVETQTIEVFDGISASGEKAEGAVIITKEHKPYTDNGNVTKDANGNVCFTKNKPYTIQISIKCGKILTEAISVGYDIDMKIYTETEYQTAGKSGVNGVDYLYLGEYPQAKSAETAGFTATTEKFASYNEDATKTSEIGDLKRDVYTKDGKRYVEMDGAYYEIQPLKWRILSTTNGYSLMCDTIIEQVYYQQFYSGSYAVIDGVTSSTIYANNYKESTLRKFLNEIFYESAFTNAERALIQKTIVKNDDASMGGSDPNGYSCEDTEDWVYALSYQDIRDLYFVDNSLFSATSIMYTSDYAKATGVNVAFGIEEARDAALDAEIDMAYLDYGLTFTKDREGRIAYLMSMDPGWGISDEKTANEIYEAMVGSGDWWLRSPFYYYAYHSSHVYYYGSTTFNHVHGDDLGCVPSLLLDL